MRSPTRRNPLLALLTLAALAACGDQPAGKLGRERQSTVTPQPGKNVVVIMVDDLDSGSLKEMLDLGFMPNLRDRVINQGVEFRESFVSYSLCCPSRTTFLTGQYPHNHLVVDNMLPLGGVTKLKDDNTVATWLQQAGYYTGHVGKYLNGYGYDGEIFENGRYRYYAALKKNKVPQDDFTYVPPGYTEWHGLVGQSTYRVFGYCIKHARPGVVPSPQPTCYGDELTGKDYQTDVLADIASGFIERARASTKPFFLVVTPMAPHTEARLQLPGCENTRFGAYIRPDPKDKHHKKDAWNKIFGDCPESTDTPKQIACTPPLELATKSKPSFNEDDMNDKPLWLQAMLGEKMTDSEIRCLERQHRSRLGALLAIDDLVGKIVDKVDLDNTVIVFTADNGYLQGEHRWDTKLLAYEESIRVPLYIRAPGQPPTSAPRFIDRMALNNDLAQTVADYAGVTPQRACDGRSLRSLVEGVQPPSWRTRFHVEWAQMATDGVVPYPTDLEYKAISAGPSTKMVSFSGVRLGAGAPSYENMLYGQLWSEGVPVGSSSECYDLVLDPYQQWSWGKGSPITNRCMQPGVGDYLENVASKLRTCKADSCRSLEDRDAE